MNVNAITGRCVLGAILLTVILARTASAQEATLVGTATDTSGGAMPGVTVIAIHEATGNSFEAVTDVRGAFRIPVRVGQYRISAELSGFTAVTKSVAVLLGQEADVSFQMNIGGLTEALTVTAERPLVQTTQSSISGHIDPEQAQALPLNGRNWMDLVLLAPGARGNAVDNRATAAPSWPGRRTAV